MKEDFVPYDIAVKLKEKGFKEKCIAYYWEKINEHTPSFLVEDNMTEDGISILDLLSDHNLPSIEVVERRKRVAY